MKRLLTLILCAMLLMPILALGQEEPLYTALLRYNAMIYPAPNVTGDQQIGGLDKGKRVDIYEVLPAWLKIGREGQVLGYIKRERLDDYTVTTLQTGKVPAYPGIQNTFLGWVKGTTAVRATPSENGEELITLNDGARLAFIGLENGWAKLIFKRQYGYVDTRDLKELQSISLDNNTDPDAPIAAYTSFYNISTDENNLSRIKNLEVSCEKFAKLAITPGANFDFNRDLGPYRSSNGYYPAIVLIDGGTKLGYGGGTCQASSTLYNVVLQLPGLSVDHRRPHGPGGISYLPHGADAAVGNQTQNFKFSNNYLFPVRIEGTVQDGALTICIWRASDTLNLDDERTENADIESTDVENADIESTDVENADIENTDVEDTDAQ